MSLPLNNQNHGYYDQLYILNHTTGNYERVRDLITSAGQTGGGTVQSANAPLSISNGALSIDLTTYINTTALNTALQSYALLSSLHQALRLGVADVDHSHLVFTCEKLELHANNNPNLKSRLELDLTGNLVWNNIGQSTVDAIATVPYVTSQLSNYWQYFFGDIYLLLQNYNFAY